MTLEQLEKWHLFQATVFYFYFEGTMDLLIGRPEDGIEVSKQESQYSQ